MKRLALLLFLFSYITSYSQISVDSIQTNIVGKWIIEEMTINGVINPDFDPSFKDVINLRENGTQTTTDKEYEYEQTGPWRIIDEKYLELNDSDSNEVQILEILSISKFKLKLKVYGVEHELIMNLIKQ